MDLSTNLTEEQKLESKALADKKTEELLAMKQAEQDPMAAAAGLFGIYAPVFQEKTKHLSEKQLYGLVNTLIQYPLNTTKFFTEHDKALNEAFLIGQNLLEAKFIVMMMAVNTHDGVTPAAEAAQPATQVAISPENENGSQA